MSSFNTLQEFENIYDALKPAQRKCPETFAWFSGVPHPLFNAIMHLHAENELDKKIDQVLALAPRGIPLSFWLQQQKNADEIRGLLIQREFQLLITCPLMEWKVKPISLNAQDIKSADLSPFMDIMTTVFQFDPAVKTGLTELLKATKLENYILYINNQPVTTGSIARNDKTTAIFNIATLPEFQKKGCAKTIMEFLMNRAHELNAERTILLSDPMTQQLYSELGFTKCCDIEIFARFPSA